MNSCVGTIMDELVEIVLNHEGNDYHVVVDYPMANILLNDPDEARKYIQECLSTGSADAADSGNNNDHNLVWIRKRPTEADQEATKYFLTLREKLSTKFDDRKTVKSQLWGQIAKQMNEAGYYVGEGSEKCRLKFANLQKQYLAHIRHMNTTGEKYKEPPLYFEIMHGILGGKDKVNPSNLQDSLDTSEEENSEPRVNGPSTSSGIKNRFSTPNKSVRPKSANSMLIDVLKEQHEEEKQERNKQFQILEDLIKTQNEQREKLLDKFQNLIDLKKEKKRKHSSDSE